MNQILYNCHTDGDQYRITKFNDGEVESSYLCTVDECECPAGHRPSCRHRHMLPRFIAKGAVNTFYFYDYDRQGWVTNEPNGQMQQYFKAEEPAEPANYGPEPTANQQAMDEFEERSSLSVPDEPPSFEKHEKEIDNIAAMAEPPLRRRI